MKEREGGCEDKTGRGGFKGGVGGDGFEREGGKWEGNGELCELISVIGG